MLRTGEANVKNTRARALTKQTAWRPVPYRGLSPERSLWKPGHDITTASQALEQPSPGA
jgi:hypothetical protein